ncbi:MAG: TonB-dependent receptor, partial [Bryobacteraceae bacterium]|nr:TonB-dependent receptor [Bryobacteraceae bacterium]
MRLSVAAVAVFAVSLAVAPASAQEVRASITGIVTDSTGAAVAGATVTVTSATSNVALETRTNAGGNYTTPFLNPGTYRLTVQFAGFKQYVRENIVLQTQDRARVDVSLTIGEVSESVTVSESVSMLETETASRSQVIANKLIEEVPTQGRNPFQLAWAAAGVIKTGDWRFLRSFDTGGTSNFSVNGGVNKENEILVDGISNVRPSRDVVHVPAMETIQEFKVLTNTYDAQYGRTGGGTVSIVTKGGGNQFKGSLFHYFQAEEMNANQSELNRGGVAKPPMAINVFGFQASGPVWIPKVVDGRNKLFWTLSYEGLRQRSADPGTATLPLQEWRQGNFASLLNAQGAPITIYDPLTTAANGIRTPFAGNVIPQNRINPIATNLLGYYPLPNSAGTGPAQVNNYIYPSRWIADMDQWSGRADYSINDRNRVYFRYAQNPFSEIRSLVWGGSNPAEPSGNAPLLRNGRNWAADWTSTLSPTTTLNIRAGLSRWETSSGNIYGFGFNPAQLGFSQDLVNQFIALQFPRFNLGTYQAIGSDRVYSTSPDDTYSLQPNVNMVVRNHFFKFGADLRRYNSNTNDPGGASGNYTFNRQWTQQRALQSDAVSGNELASLLLGYPASGYADLNMNPAYRHHYYSLFFNDDWKVTPRLTLNLGVRWDYETPVVERYDRQFRGFNYDAASPIDAQAVGINLRGAVEFAGINGNPRTAFNPDKNNFQPRIGVAYRMFNKTVLRGGYGLYYLGQNERGSALGFSQRTNLVASLDGNLTPAISITNPFANQP